jgi:secondary thiamine-phosphate synthase enzyme
MGVFRKSISVKTRGINDFVNITSEIEKVAKESKIKTGMVFVNTLHNTGSLLMQEDDSSIHSDLVNMFERITPLKGKYEHDYENNENATAHLKTSLLTSDLTIPIENEKLILGTWQQIFFIEFFEPRQRQVIVTVIGD